MARSDRTNSSKLTYSFGRVRKVEIKKDPFAVIEKKVKSENKTEKLVLPVLGGIVMT